jgi:nucleoside 2-deoxyribosyltransferase
MEKFVKKNVLKHSICYLIGPIDNASDQGKGWRQMIKKRCAHMNIKFLDPTNKLRGLVKEVDNEQKKIKEYKEVGNWKELSLMMKQVVRSDLRSIDYADFVIVYVDTDIHMCGSYHEMTVAINQKKPVLIVVEGGKKYASSWLFGVCDYNFMFDNFEDLLKYLRNVNKGKEKLNDRWVLIRKQLQSKNVKEK